MDPRGQVWLPRPVAYGLGMAGREGMGWMNRGREGAREACACWPGFVWSGRLAGTKLPIPSFSSPRCVHRRFAVVRSRTKASSNEAAPGTTENPDQTLERNALSQQRADTKKKIDGKKRDNPGRTSNAPPTCTGRKVGKLTMRSGGSTPLAYGIPRYAFRTSGAGDHPPTLAHAFVAGVLRCHAATPPRP